MGEHRCSQCGKTYRFDEYMALDKVPINPEEDDPMEGSGYEKVCECGAKFHTGKWSLREAVDTDEGEVTVSTVALTMPHGPHHRQWFETCLFTPHGSSVTDRYHTQNEAEEGHERRVSQLERGDYSYQPTGKRIVVD